MSNIKWGVVFGAGAFVLSLCLGALSGANFGVVFLRALLFLFMFFGLGVGVHILMNNYFPELLYGSEDTPGPQISFDKPAPEQGFSLGIKGEYAVPEMFRESRDSDELGNIEDLISGVYKPSSEGIDRKTEEVYNGSEDRQVSVSFEPFPSLSEEKAEVGEPVRVERPVFTPSFGDDSDGLEGLPDLGSMAMAFAARGDSPATPFGGGSLGGGGETSSLEMADESPDILFSGSSAETYNKGNKPQPLEGDFDPKELAQGIRTVLSKEN